MYMDRFFSGMRKSKFNVKCEGRCFDSFSENQYMNDPATFQECMASCERSNKKYESKMSDIYFFILNKISKDGI